MSAVRIWQDAGRADYRTRRGRAEKDVDAAVVRLLRLLGYYVTRLQQTRSSRQTRGVPDLYCMHPQRRNVWVELKAPGETLSADQQAWHAAAMACGEWVIIAHSAAELAARLEPEAR